MQLSYNSDRSVWEAAAVWGEQDVPKAAGLKWNKIYARWETPDVRRAAQLRAYADAANQEKLDTALAVANAKAAEEADRKRAAVEASRAKDSDAVIPCGGGQTFLPYQRAGISFALARRHCLIGDDMGLAKTAQAVGVINADEPIRTVLIVCPASLCRNWVREIGAFGSRPLTVGIATQKKCVPDTDIVVCTYDIFSRKAGVASKIKDRSWDALVLDEAHYCKNGKSARTKEILGGDGSLPITARRRIYLTGTPIPNKPIELWPLVKSLAPGEFGDFFDFAKRYCNAHQDGYGWDMTGASHLDELQDKLRGSIMVRRLKSEVLTELPAKRRQIIELAAETPEAKAALKVEAAIEKECEREIAAAKAILARNKPGAASADPAAYKAALAALGAARSVAFTQMSKVRHQTALAKAPMVAEHVRGMLEGSDGKIIVFAHHRDVIDSLKEALGEFGVVSITGDTHASSRQDAVDAFQTNPAIRVFIGNLIAAGVGITLTASSTVVFAELDWVPGTLSQAEYRAHRLGQVNSVLVQHLVLEGSLDAKMAITVTNKQTAIDAALNDIEDPDAREARIAEMQTVDDAATEKGVAAAELRLLERQETAEAERVAAEVRKADREARHAAKEAEWEAEQAAREDGRRERISDAIARSAAALGDVEAPGRDQTDAILGILRILASLDSDGATIRNGLGFNKADSYQGHELASRDRLTGGEAKVGLTLVRRYTGQHGDTDSMVLHALNLPVPDLVPVLVVTETPVPEAAPVEAVVVPRVSDRERRAILGCLKILFRRNPADASLDVFRQLTELTDLTDGEAQAAREILRGRRADFPAAATVVDLALGEPPPALADPEISVLDVTENPPPAAAIFEDFRREVVARVCDAMAIPDAPPATSAPVARRGRGRPTKASQGQEALSQVERTRRWRAARKMATLEMPGAVAERIRALREARGVSTEALLAAALDALERAADQNLGVN